MITKRIYIPSSGRPEIFLKDNFNSTYNQLKNLGYSICIVVPLSEYDEYRKMADELKVKVGITWTRATNIAYTRLYIVKHAIGAKLDKIIIADDDLVFKRRYKSKGTVKVTTPTESSLKTTIDTIFNDLEKVPQVAIASRKESFEYLESNLKYNYSCTKFVGYDLRTLGMNVEFCRMRFLDYIDINLQLLAKGFKNKVYLNTFFDSDVKHGGATKYRRPKDNTHCAEVIKSLHYDTVKLDVHKIIRKGSYKIRKYVKVNWSIAYKEK